MQRDSSRNPWCIVSTAPERRSRFVRWLRVSLRVAAVSVVVLLLLAACAVVILYADYAARNGELLEMPLEGPAKIIAGFEGRWYLGQLVLKAKVKGGRSPSLTVRFGPDCKVRGARVEGEGLVFDYNCPEGSGATGLRFIEPGQLLWSKPGAPHSGCTTCTPTLTRASAWTRAKAWAEILGQISSGLVRDGLNAVELWFVRHL